MRAFACFLSLGLVFGSSLWGSTGTSRLGAQEYFNKVSETLDILRQEVRNLQEYQEVLNEKICTQEDAIEDLQRLVRKERDQTLASVFEKMREQEQKSAQSGTTNKTFSIDLNMLKDAFERQQAELQGFRKDAIAQKKALASLQSALEALLGTAEDEEAYLVLAGDSLGSIAKKFKTKIYLLKERNQLKSDIIRPGQKLIIPK